MRLIHLVLPFLSLSLLAQEAKLVTQQSIRGTITNFEFSPDGEYVANCSENDNSIHVWHLASEKIIGSLQGYPQPLSIAYNSKGDELLSLHDDNLIIRWDLDKWVIADSIRLENKPTWIGFGGDQVLVSTQEGLTLYESGFSSSKSLKVKGEVQSGLCTEEFGWVGTDRGELSKINLTTGTVISQTMFDDTDFQDINLSNKENRILAFNSNGSVSIIAKDQLSLTKNVSPLSGINFGSQYGKVHAGKGQVVYISEDNQIDCYNLEGNLLFKLVDTVEAEKIKVLEFSPDGNVLCSSSFKETIFKQTKTSQNSIKVWDLTRKGLIGELKGSVNPVKKFSFDPERNIVAILGEGRIVSFWDMDYAEKLFEHQLMEPKKEQKMDLLSEKDKEESTKTTSLFGIKAKVPKLSTLKDKVVDNTVRRTVNQKLRKEPVLLKFSSKGNYLITKLDEDEVRIYRLEEEKVEYLHFAQHQQERINNFITSPDEKHLICLGAGDKAISIVDLETGELVKKLRTENDDANYEFFNNAISISYNPTGKNFAVCTGRGQVFVWSSGFSRLFKSEGSNVFRAGSNAFVNYSKDGKTLYLNGITGVRGYDIHEFNVLGTTELKMPGTPYPLNMPQDYIVGFDDQTGYIEDLETNKLTTFKINKNLINDVDASLRDYIGIALKNGEFRVIDANSGQLLATFIGEGQNTIIKTEENYYKVNKDGFELVSFRVGRKAYPFEQFDAYYNRPDLVLKSLKCPDEDYIELYANAHDRRLQKLNIEGDETPDFSALPQLSILNRGEIPFSQKDKFVDLNLKGSSKSSELASMRVTINSVPVEEHTLSGKSFEEEVSIELIAGINKVNVYIKNKSGEESLAESLTINCGRTDKPNLFLITVGTSDYKDDRFDLNYAAKDAKDLNTLFSNYDAGHYASVKTLTMTNEEVQKEAFDKLKAFLADSKRNDQVVFYIAGHGLLDENYAYYYGTYDVDFLSPQTRGLSYNKLEEILAGIAPVKKLLIMDTCHSGEVEADEVEVVENDGEEEEDLAFEDVTFRAVGPKLREGDGTRASAGKMSRLLFADIRKGTGATVISSAGGVEFAMEGDDWKNGLFTYCLLNGMTNKTADLNNDGTIMLSELQQYLIDKVGKLSNGKQVPTTRVQNIRLDYPIW
jgi:WD40 repeat protein